MTRPNLPASRDERIALAHTTIAGCLGPEDQLDAGHRRAFDDASIVVFRVLLPTFERGLAIRDGIDKALDNAGFSGHYCTTPDRVGDGQVVRIRVPVGAP